MKSKILKTGKSTKTFYNDSNQNREFLEGYPDYVINHWKNNKKEVVVKNYKQLDILIDEAINTTENINKRLHLGRINESIVHKIKNMIHNFPKKKINYFSSSIYDIVLNQSEIRHLKENKIRVTNNDIHNYIKKIPDTISQPDTVIYSDNGNSEGLRFEKRFSDGKYYSFTLVNDKKKTLQVKTSFIDTLDFEIKKRSMSLPKDAQRAPSGTSETSKASASIKNIP